MHVVSLQLFVGSKYIPKVKLWSQSANEVEHHEALMRMKKDYVVVCASLRDMSSLTNREKSCWSLSLMDCPIARRCICDMGSTPWKLVTTVVQVMTRWQERQPQWLASLWAPGFNPSRWAQQGGSPERVGMSILQVIALFVEHMVKLLQLRGRVRKAKKNISCKSLQRR